MLKKSIGLVVVILLFTTGVTQAQVAIIYSSAGKQYFSMTIPDDWRVNVGSEKDLSQNPQEQIGPARLISAMPNSGVPLWFAMWVPDDLESIEDAREYVSSLGLDLLDNVAISELTHDTLDAMKVQYVSGTGDKEGEAMDFRAGFFQLSPDRVAIAIYIGPSETTISHGEDLAGMIQSLHSLVQ
ncbi:MAG: hypothetical protein ACR2PB_05955 [Desulfocapsaceae bacterium]